MDSFELNKIMGAVLGTLLFVMGAGFVAEAIYKPVQGQGPGYALPEPEVVVAGAPAAVDAAPVVALGTLLASASVERGASAAKKCQSCHNFGEGQPNKQGPHLYDIVGRAEGSVSDYSYSTAMAEHHAAGDTWTYENLDHFLTKPSDYAPGTKMAFAGIKTAEERADLLAYLQTLSGSPVPFPAADAAAPEADAAPAEAAPAVEAPAEVTDAPAAEAPAAEAATPAEAAPAEAAPATTTP